jgi:hypothetical protein
MDTPKMTRDMKVLSAEKNDENSCMDVTDH